MVERLCRDYGTPLLHSSNPKLAGLCDTSVVKEKGPAEEEQQQQEASVPDLAFYTFPSLEQLSSASEAALRAEGFGYRYAIELFPCNAYTLHTLEASDALVVQYLLLLCICSTYAHVDPVVLRHAVGRACEKFLSVRSPGIAPKESPRLNTAGKTWLRIW